MSPETVEFIKQFGLPALMVVWLLLRHEGKMDRMATKVDRAIVGIALIARTIDLEKESGELIDAVFDPKDPSAR